MQFVRVGIIITLLLLMWVGLRAEPALIHLLAAR